eukprot:205383-Chlamydomonas_euryale.AAC.1
MRSTTWHICGEEHAASVDHTSHTSHTSHHPLRTLLQMPFDAEHAMARSVWFNRELTDGDAAMREKARLITATMEADAEALAGYEAPEWLS